MFKEPKWRGRPRTLYVARWMAALPPGDGALTKATCRVIAIEDWQSHPEDWPRDRYPASQRDDQFPDSLRTIENRVYAAIRKALQNTVN